MTSDVFTSTFENQQVAVSITSSFLSLLLIEGWLHFPQIYYSSTLGLFNASQLYQYNPVFVSTPHFYGFETLAPFAPSGNPNVHALGCMLACNPVGMSHC